MKRKGPRWRRGDLVKTCARCFVAKPVEEFAGRHIGDEARASYCRLCNTAAVVEWTRKKPDQHRSNVRSWRRNNLKRANELSRLGYRKDIERSRKLGRANYLRNADKRRAARRAYYQANKVIENQRYREWRLKNAARNAHKSMMYEARKRRAMPPWADREKIFAVYERCAEMNKKSIVKFQVDHIHPLCSSVLCGLHVHYNLQIIPSHDNQRKSNKVVGLDAGADLCGA